MTRGKILPVGLLLTTAAIVRCVGDSSTPLPDGGGKDATTTDVVSDTAVSDAGADADAASGGRHAYVVSGNSGPAGALYVYDLPLSSASTPSVTLTANFKALTDVELVPGATPQLLVLDNGSQKISIFNLPITSSSVAVTTFAIDFVALDCVFDLNGNLWVAGNSATLEKFTPPFTNNSAPSQKVTLPAGQQVASAIGVNPNIGTLFVATDANSHMYVFEPAKAPTDGGVFTALIDNPNVNKPRGIVVGVNPPKDIFVTDVQAGHINQFSTPMGDASTPTILAASLLSAPIRMKFNLSEQLLAVADTNKGLVVLDGPAYNTSSITIANPEAGLGAMRSVTFGP